MIVVVPSSDHERLISNAKLYSVALPTEKEKFQAETEKQTRKVGGSELTDNTSTNKQHEINHIYTAFLFNGITSEMKTFATENPHMALLDKGSLVAAVKRAEMLSDLRTVDNELKVTHFFIINL